MPDLSWKSKYELGIPMMDEQHKRLFFLLTQLRQAVITQQSRNQVSGILQNLIDQTREHLRTEEELMAAMFFPGLVEHQAAHEKLVTGLHGLEVRFREGDASMALLVTTYLGGWLRTHIAVEDRTYGIFWEDMEEDRSA